MDKGRGSRGIAHAPLAAGVGVTVMALVVGLLAAASAAAVETPPELYHCKPKEEGLASPPPPPKLPPHVEAQLPATIADDEFRRVCPPGEVPYPTKSTAPVKLSPELARAAAPAGERVNSGRFSIRTRVSGHRRNRGGNATASRSELFPGFWYSHAVGTQSGLSASKGYNGMWVWQTNEQPYIPYAENMESSHSLAQIWASRQYGGCTSTVEIGWTESAGQFKGNYEPHLFISAWDCGVWLGYMSLESPLWKQSSAVVWPGAVVSHNDKFHAYGARMDGNNWWFYYDGQWVGYIPNSAWKTLYPSYLTKGQAGGEVATKALWTCADMGYGGLFGSHPWAAMFSDVWYEFNYQTQVELAKLQPYATDSGNYNTGNWSEGIPGAEFRYGGPGWC